MDSRGSSWIGFPCCHKSNSGGSEVGTQRADDSTSLVEALKIVSQFDSQVIVEECVRAREIEVAVMGNESPRTAVIGEVRTSESVEYYDYEAKYFKADGAEVLVPAELPAELAAKVRRLAIQAYKALGCRGLSRVDFFLERDTNRLLINEINTLPGFTLISIFPKAFAASGVPLEILVKKLCQYAVAEKKTRTRQEQI